MGTIASSACNSSNMKFLLVLCFFALAFAGNFNAHAGKDFRQCAPVYRNCHETAKSEEAESKCFMTLHKCINETCDTSKCDAPGKACWEKSKTKRAKRVCGYTWWKCVNKSCS